MLFKNLARSAILNFGAAAAGLGGTIFITWTFGLAEFAYYTINFAKLSLILLGAEVLPSSFTIFRLQEDREFTRSLPVFYAGFAALAAVGEECTRVQRLRRATSRCPPRSCDK